MKKINLLIVLSLGLTVNVFSQQDPHFSQFFSSPLTLNPASAGIFNGDLRAIMNYRSQWSSITESYKTTAASVDMPIAKKMRGGMFGLGLNLFKDGAGDSKFSNQNYALSFAYHLDVSGGKSNHFLSIGFQAGMIQRSISSEQLTWDNQWTGVEFNTLVQSSSYNELERVSANAFDLSTGVHWYYKPTPYSKFNAGLSMFHVTSPDIGFISESKLLRKYTLHAGGEIPLSEGKSAITPNFVTVIQGANKYTVIGGELKIVLQENSKFTNFKNAMYMSIGPYFRWNDAAYIVARYSWNGMIVSLSYDFNISGLSSASGVNGGLEFMLGYKKDISSRPSRGHRFK
jgi:type IX secretion system PorP/SprF family membrane protein